MDRDAEWERPEASAHPPGTRPLPAKEEIVYGIDAGGIVMFAPRHEAERLSRLCQVMSNAKTWGEVRAILLPDEVDALTENYRFEDAYYVPAEFSGDDDVVLPPPDGAPFEARRATEELGWLDWPPERMYDW